MNPNYLDFEQPIADLEVKIEELRLVGSDNEINIGEEIETLRAKSTKLTEKIYSNLSTLADRQGRASPAAPLHHGLPAPGLRGVRRIARRPSLRRRQGHRRRGRAAGGPAGDGNRPGEGARGQGQGVAQFRHAQARGLPQGPAPDGNRRALQDAGDHADRYPRGLSRASIPRSAASARRLPAIWRSCRGWPRPSSAW